MHIPGNKGSFIERHLKLWMFQNHDKTKQKDNYQNMAPFFMLKWQFHFCWCCAKEVGVCCFWNENTERVLSGQITTAALALQQSPLWHSIIQAQLFTTSRTRPTHLPIYHSVNLCRCTRISGLISRGSRHFGYTKSITYNLRLYVRALSRTRHHSLGGGRRSRSKVVV